jgi:ParB family chromosome partitioning protein
MKRSALGRGLAALIPEGPALRPAGGAEIPVAEITPNPLQPRRHFAEAGLAELATSIREHGLLQPVVVSRAPGGGFHLVAGERRWRAARLAGIERIPAVVREITHEGDQLALALIENLLREDLTPIEEARAFHYLRVELGLSQEEVAARVGKDRSTVANAIRLLQLPLPVQELVDAGGLSAGHARALAGIAERDRQEELAGRCVAAGWSVRELERRLRVRVPKPERAADPETTAAAERLALRVGAAVEIVRRRRGGEVRIRYSSEQELIRLFRLLMQENP